MKALKDRATEVRAQQNEIAHAATGRSNRSQLLAVALLDDAENFASGAGKIVEIGRNLNLILFGDRKKGGKLKVQIDSPCENEVVFHISDTEDGTVKEVTEDEMLDAVLAWIRTAPKA